MFWLNKVRRTKLSEVCNLLLHALQIVSLVKDEEQNSLDNIPENLQNSELYTLMEDTIDKLDDVSEKIEEAMNSVSGSY